jgi:hypothetical protein
MKYYIKHLMFDINIDSMDRSQIVREFTDEELSANPNAGILEILALEAANPGQDYIWCPADTAGAWYIAQWEAKKAARGII